MKKRLIRTIIFPRTVSGKANKKRLRKEVLSFFPQPFLLLHCLSEKARCGLGKL